MDLSLKIDKIRGVKYRYGHNSIFQKMDLKLFYFDATNIKIIILFANHKMDSAMCSDNASD